VVELDLLREAGVEGVEEQLFEWDCNGGVEGTEFAAEIQGAQKKK
jgi:hypothetical protein